LELRDGEYVNLGIGIATCGNLISTPRHQPASGGRTVSFSMRFSLMVLRTTRCT